MTNKIKISAVAAMILAGSALPASAWDIKDLLGGAGETVENLIEGVFTKSNLTVEDICGEWITDGSAVSFKSDNFLQKAGGVAAAAAIETKINPYYEQLGLNNAVMTIRNDGTFTFKAKMITLQGTLSANGDGTFEFEFKAFGKMSLGRLTAYVQKSGNHVDIMFDATKLKTLVATIAKYTGTTLVKTAASILDSYEGLCVGFGMEKRGSSGASGSGNTGGQQQQKSDSTDGIGEAAGALLNILKGAGGK